MRASIISAAVAASSLAAAQDFIVNGNASNLLSCRGSQLRNDYCCFDGTFFGPAWNSDDSITMVRKSLLTIRQVKGRFEKRDIVTEMAPGLTCSGFAAITLTNEDASALLASATRAADAAGEGAGESDDIASTSVGGSQAVSSTGSQTGETQVSTAMTSTSATSAGGESSSVSSSSTNGGVAMATHMPLLVVGGMVGVMGYVL